MPGVNMQLVKMSRTQGAVACLAVCLSGAVVAVPSSARAQGAAGNMKEAEAPAVSATNASPALAAPRFDALRRLEEQLNQSLKRFSPRNEAEGVGSLMRPAPRTTIINSRPDNRSKDALNRKNDLGGWNLEEMMGLSRPDETGDELDPDSSDSKPKRSLIEQYYDSQGRRGSGQESGMKSADDPLGTANKPKEDDSLSPRLRETQTRLQKLIANDGDGRIFGSMPERVGMSDIFGLPNGSMSAVNAEISHRAYMEQYRDVLGISGPGADAGKSLNSLSSTSAKTPLSTPSTFSGTTVQGSG